ncbi:MAG: oligosaccharide flippase family protein [Pseudomonadota bacterium]
MTITELFKLSRDYWRVRKDEFSSLISKAREFINLHVLNKRRAGDFVYLSSQISTPVFGLVTSIIAARYLLPYELGVIQTVMLVTVYCSYFHFGVFNGLNRNIAFYAAQQNTTKLQDMVDASWLVAVINAFIGVLISVVVLVYFYLHGYSRLYLYSVATIFGILTFLPICTHYETIYRGCRSFMPLGISLNISSFANLVLGFLPIVFGALGLIFRYAVSQMITFFLLFKKSPIKHRSVGKLDEIVDLVRVGSPMLITGVLYMFYTAADRTIVAMTLGPSAVGELALSGMVITAIQILPMSLGALFYPRASYIYGLSKTSLALKRVLILSLTLNVITLIPLCLMSYFLIGPVTERFLPHYIGGIKAAKIYSLGSMFLVYFGVTMIFPVVRRNVPFMVGCVVSILIMWILGMAFVKNGFGIEGIAWARLIANVFMCIFVFAYTYYFTKREIKA